MRRFMVLVTVVVLITAMLVATMTPAFAYPPYIRCPDGPPECPGKPMPPTSLACAASSSHAAPVFEERGAEVCWLVFPTPASSHH